MKYENLAKEIIKNVGGKENVSGLTHCITRLRFKLKDEKKANTDVLKNMEGVVTVVQSSGQYQVVIGNHVPDVYADVVTVAGLSEGSGNNSPEKMRTFHKLIDIISGVFQPVLGVLAATGMIKGFLAMFAALGWLSNESGAYTILQTIGDSLFYFFPIFLGLTAAKKFKANQFIAVAIAGALVYPDMSAMFSAGEAVNFLGIPVVLMSYSSTVVPIILSVFVLAKFEQFLNKTDMEDLKAEYLLPTIIGELLKEGTVSVKVLKSEDQWFGVTYKEDRETVVEAVKSLIDKGIYPDKL